MTEQRQTAAADELLFSEEISDEREEHQRPWKILIADDEEEVHAVTRMVLDNFTFEEQGLHLLSAYSGAETIEQLRQHPDTAIVFLDVVMEEETTGLEVARYIREELHNTFVRIILRTGQPGQAPEKQVTIDYDINDYKEKTELTAQKLFTTIIGSLRAYRDLRTIEKNKRGLEKIVTASADLFEIQSLRQFTTKVLTQLTALLNYDFDILANHADGMAITYLDGEYTIIAGNGRFEQSIGKTFHEVVPPETRQLIMQATHTRSTVFASNEYVAYFGTRSGSEHLLYLHSTYELNELDRELLLVFSSNVTVALENVYLNRAIIETQREVIFTLGEVIETRSQETGNHVKRVAAYSYLLALKVGLSEVEAERLRLASPMHDIGKIGVPDSILNKPGSLTNQELEVIKIHPIIGHDILKGSKQKILQTAAIIALQHHERWDGGGYPHGLVGEATHIFARITALADVFDALSHERVYKEAWDLDQIVTLMRNERGRHFDPELVNLFFESLDELLAIQRKYPEAETDN